MASRCRSRPAPGAPPLYIAQRDGRLWFIEDMLCAALGIPHQAARLLGGRDRLEGPVVTAGGRGSAFFVSEYGFHVLAVAAGLGQAPAAGEFHRWAVESLLPAVRAALRPPARSAPAIAMAELVRRKLKDKRQSKAGMNCAALLAHLWLGYSDGRPLRVGQSAMAELLRVNRRSLGRAMNILIAWGLVGTSSRLSGKSSDEWPDLIRLNREAVLSALAEFGIEPDSLPSAAAPAAPNSEPCFAATAP